MELKSIEKKEEGKFITRYDLHYETEDGSAKTYEIISRDKDIESEDRLKTKKIDAVVLIMTTPDESKILLNKEFRMACGDWVYNFPAGLIEEGETPDIAAARELYEETGLRITEIDDKLGLSFSAVGFSNEKNACIIGTAEGTIKPSNSEFEEIEANWYTKEEVRELLRTKPFAARTQAYCYLWSRDY